MPEPLNLGIAFGLPPKEAIEYFESKGFRTRHWNWWDTWQEANARAFTIARTARLDVQQAIRNRLHQALSQGMTEHDFIRQLTPELQKMGWWGRKILVDSGGRAEVVREGSLWRLKTIYRTNMMTAYNVGRYKAQQDNVDSRPYWMYVAVMDAKTRASHAAMHGRVFRYDDPIWDTHYPPCSFNCRCRVRALTEKQVQRRGLVVESAEGRLREVTQDVGIDKRTGEVVQRPGTEYTAPDGRTMTPSPGWNYNPGKAFYQPDLERYDDDLARQYVEGTLTGPAFERTCRRIDDAVARFAASAEAQGLGKQEVVASLRNNKEVAVGELYAVAILPPTSRHLLGVRSKVVKLSDDTLLKQAVSRGGQDFDFKDYWQVQHVIERAEVIVREGENVLAFVRRGDVWYHAVVKRTRDGQALFLTSFRRTNERGLRKAMKKGEVVRDAR